MGERNYASPMVTTPIEVVRRNYPLIKGVKKKISKKWNKRWPDIERPWPVEGTFNREVVETIRVLVSAYKAGHKKGKRGEKRKEKREWELGLLKIFDEEGLKLNREFQQRKEKIKAEVQENMEEAKNLMEKANMPFSHVSPVKNPPPYDVSEDRGNVYSQLPIINQEGRYQLETEDKDIVETGRAKTTIIMHPSPARKRNKTRFAKHGTFDYTRKETELTRQILLDLPKIDYDIQLWAIDWLKSTGKYLPKEIMDLLEGIASCKLTRLNDRKSDALSSLYPTTLGPSQQLAFELLSEVHPMTYLVNCMDAWVTVTGQDPNSHPLNQALFRQAVLGGCPSDVQKMMTNSPTLPTSDDVNWRTHFLYYVQQSRMRAEEETEKTSKLQNDFLNSQIQEAKRASSNACKKEKLGRSNQMSISVFQQAPPRLITPTPQLQATPQHYGLPTRQGRDAWLGGGLRREGGRGRGSHGSQAGCFICGDVNHWTRKCPRRRHPPVHQSGYDQQALTPPPQNQQQ
ncbi:uncharacterized protein LOC127594728 [Hippocampus zosterae]|uniref:uncharacterized protein LOC127594728 n=1 Tax=Hippocampus zosterae TaxID=109293 RepID=UPI00223CB11D|nr:uncharacterized protein LOC127594728 [Hippocampus zosterae]XP_051912468.1 uncharacterized protein LOC127594728 [Hippocampus zosterae]